MITAREILSKASDALAAAGRQEVQLNAELLLEHAAGKPRLHFQVNPEENLSPEAVKRFNSFIKKRATGLPLAYITGTQHFRGLELRVTPAVLIPRPETEELAGLALAELASIAKTAPVALDLCTGSGCIACALASENANCRVIASDVSPSALRVARENAKKLGLSQRISFSLSNLFKDLKGRADVIVSNPPYVPATELPALEKELSFEPALALDGGPDGLLPARAIVAGAPAHLQPGGKLLLELALGQPQRLKRELDAKIWDNIGIAKDMQGVERFLTATLTGAKQHHG